MTKERGIWFTSEYVEYAIAALHPAYVLRRGLKGQEMRRLVADLEHARRFAGL